MNRHILAVTLLTIAVLACGVQTTTPKAVDHLPAVSKMATPTASTRHALVCMAGTLYFRTDAGMSYPAKAWRVDGDEVDVFKAEKVTPDGATWRETSLGWANARFLCMEQTK